MARNLYRVWVDISPPTLPSQEQVADAAARLAELLGHPEDEDFAFGLDRRSRTTKSPVQSTSTGP